MCALIMQFWQTPGKGRNKVGQDIYTPLWTRYMTVYLVISQPEITVYTGLVRAVYIHRV